MPFSLILYSLRRLKISPLGFATSSLLTALSTVALLAIVNSYQAQVDSIESSSFSIAIVPRDSSFEVPILKPLFERISEFARINYLENKIEILADSDSTANSIVQTLRSALDSKNFRLSLQADNNQQTKELLNALSANLLIVIILVSVVSSLIIAASTELSFLESSSDLKAFGLLSVKSYQILFVLMLQIMIPAALGCILALMLYANYQNYFNQYVLDSLVQVSTINQIENSALNLNQCLLAFIYAIFVSGLACLFAIRHSGKNHDRSARFRSLSSNRLKLIFISALSVLFFTSALILKINSKAYAYCLVLSVIIFIVCLTPLLSFTLNQLFRKASWPSLRIVANYLIYSRSWTYLPYLAICLALNILIALNSLLFSFEQSFTIWLQNSLDKQLYIRQAALNDPTNSEMLPEETLKQLSSEPALTDSTYLSSSIERFNSSNILVSGSSNNLEQLSGRYNFSLSADYSDEFKNGRAVIVNEIFANRFNLKPNDSFVLLDKNWKILAIYRDYASQLPTVMLPFEILKSEFGVTGIANISFNFKKGFDQNLIYQQLKDTLLSKPQVYSRDYLINDALKIFYQTFNITIAIEKLLIGLIAVAIFLFLSLSLIQEQNSLRILQILGQTPSFYFKYCFAFGFLLCLPAILLAPVAGTALAYILVRIINPVIFGWSLDFYFSVPFYLMSTTIILLLVFVCASAGFAISQKKIKSNSAIYE